jgi:hypothetical protein
MDSKGTTASSAGRCSSSDAPVICATNARSDAGVSLSRSPSVDTTMPAAREPSRGVGTTTLLSTAVHSSNVSAGAVGDQSKARYVT